MNELINDIKRLQQVAASMPEEELIPLHLFNEALDIAYKIEQELIALEAEQIECRQRELELCRTKKIAETLAPDESAAVAPEPVVECPAVAPVTAAAPVPVIVPVPPQKESADIRKLLSLNDRFRFQRELFDGDANLFNNLLDALNTMASYAEATDYIRAQMSWREDEEIVTEFYAVLERFYSA
jgi:hypothetical protein